MVNIVAKPVEATAKPGVAFNINICHPGATVLLIKLVCSLKRQIILGRELPVGKANEQVVTHILDIHMSRVEIWIHVPLWHQLTLPLSHSRRA